MTLDQLPDDLPVPVDDGAAEHLVGMHVPSLTLPAATGGSVDLATIGSPWAVVYVYPMTGRPDVDLPEGWEAIPGARGCTPQTCGFRDHQAELAALGAEVYGLSVQTPDYQAEMVKRLHVEFPVLSDASLQLGRALDLPTMEIAGMTLYKRLTMIVRGGRIEHVMYPVFPPEQNAAEVMAWLRDRIQPKADARAAWNARYSEGAAVFGAEPNEFVAAELGGLTPRRVLDVACGQGRNSVWLAMQGHEVTGVDLSDVGIEQARRLAARVGVVVDFQVGDVVGEWQPAGEYDLILLSYLHLPPEVRAKLHAKLVDALAPGGEIFLIAHHADNLEHGFGGPPMPEVLFTEDQLSADFASLTIERNEKVYRTVERDGEVRRAHDVLMRARRPL